MSSDRPSGPTSSTLTVPRVQVCYDLDARYIGRVSRIVLNREEGVENSVEITYTDNRAKAFFSDITSRYIGTCEWRTYQTHAGMRGVDERGAFSYQPHPCFILGRVEVSVFVGWKLGSEGVWHVDLMDKRDHEHKIILPLEGLENGELFHYFQLTGYLDTDRRQALFEPHIRPGPHGVSGAEQANFDWRYADGERLTLPTVFDNPFGPYSNYHFICGWCPKQTYTG